MSRFGYGEAGRKRFAPVGGGGATASAPPRRLLYPEIEPYASGMLDADGPHQIHW